MGIDPACKSSIKKIPLHVVGSCSKEVKNLHTTIVEEFMKAHNAWVFSKQRISATDQVEDVKAKVFLRVTNSGKKLNLKWEGVGVLLLN